MTPLTLRLDGGPAVGVEPRQVVVAGYTGRDTDQVRAHIEELAAIGVPPPATVPAFYDVAPEALTCARTVGVAGGRTSGEAEPVLVRTGGAWYVGVGSDHTDRALESEDIGRAKAACPKPLSRHLAPYEPLAAEWDGGELRSWVDGEPYQRGRLSTLLRPEALLERLARRLHGGDDAVVFCGTVPLLSGGFRFGRSYRLEIAFPSGLRLRHEYTIREES